MKAVAALNGTGVAAAELAGDGGGRGEDGKGGNGSDAGEHGDGDRDGRNRYEVRKVELSDEKRLSAGEPMLISGPFYVFLFHNNNHNHS